MKVISLDEIKGKLQLEKAVALQEEGFRLYSSGFVEVPPVGYMKMGSSFGDVHIKYGWIEGNSVYVVKIAGAYTIGSNGMMIVVDACAGSPLYFLQDEG